ncbi:MAG TPA: hypothetical protein VHS78_18765 [Candidatus Elarobacter sp.]|jgi:hypothetical protein|nr:hypothetical protein [Candidatus Elarobacter sp.]
MLRYYAIAALIVVAIGSILVAHRLATSRPHVVAAKGPPPASHPGPNNGFVTTPEPFFQGQGGWVLSALPGCFDQLSSIEGPSQALTFHIPPASERIAPGTTLHAGNCTLLVRAHDLWVERGADRLRVPPEARLFETKDGLTLVYDHAGRTEVRVYARTGG